MAWTYEIADGSPLNNCWKAFCELAQALRERIIATNGDDTEAPEYELPDGSTAKAIAITDYEGTRIRSYLLRDNAEILRDAVFETYTLHTSKWCNSDASFVYLTVQEVIEEISAETDWIALADYMQADFWTQIQDVMAHLRYLVYLSMVGGNSTSDGIRGGGTGTDPTDPNDAWIDFASDYSETSGGTNIGQISEYMSVTSSGGSSWIVTSLDTVKSSGSVLFDDFWNRLAGTVIESRWCLKISAAIDPYTTLDRTVVTDYDSHSISMPSSASYSSITEYHYDDLSGAKIEFGTVEFTPTKPSTAHWGSTVVGTYAGTLSGQIEVFPQNALATMTGNTIDKTRGYFYVTDIASVVSYI